MQIVLFQPEIPQNTGNIVRTCSATQTDLILIPPLGFSLSQRQLKRAGLDYWKDVNIRQEEDLFTFLSTNNEPFYFFSSKAKKNFTQFSYKKNSILIFGSETKGLPSIFFETWPDRFANIPMAHNQRCLNLSNAVAIGLYEALRQQRYCFSTPRKN